MTKDQLYRKLNEVNATRACRHQYATLVLNEPDLFRPLMEILFMVNDKTSCKAAWVFEFVCAEQLALIIPQLNYFSENITKVHLDSAVRPVSKVCLFIVEAYFSKTENSIKSNLTSSHKAQIIEACFNWMISDQKVAPKVYAMTSLFLLGKELQWVHSELVSILEKDFSSQSAGFKAKARHIMQKLT
ncbi:adenylosuccinate lyase [Winogradskyella aurantia]|uniref:Adenylosuccinate lyase n=1 Tax=Winogradskyella aurantia TaxID=1915063 RepID=A0A265US49_9FLAO|nr:adenylosuccinate lyase [Winogradskyella aurantia]OZV68135.1 adenylosuccinate lyase [Winogradskyella aurantia]